MYTHYKLVHPEHEEFLLSSLSNESRDVRWWLREREEYPTLSFAAYLLHRRIEGVYTGECFFASDDKSRLVEWSNDTLANIVIANEHSEYYDSEEQYSECMEKVYTWSRKELLERIWDIEVRICDCADVTLSHPEMALLNGLITHENRDWIDSSDEYLFFDISIDEYIQIQDDLIAELLDVGLIVECRGENHTREYLYRDETKEETERWNKLVTPYEDDGWRGL